MITFKVAEISLKVIHRCYPCNYRLSKFSPAISSDCSFCNSFPETTNHLFWDCAYSKVFWIDFSDYIKKNIHRDFVMAIETMYFGAPKDPDISKRDFLINLFLFLAKFFIHKCRVLQRKPFFFIFMKDVKQYLSSIEHSFCPKAISTRLQCSIYKIT